MSIATSNLINKQDVVDRFNTRVRDFVTTSTSWTASTAVFNTTVGNVVANSIAAGGTVNRVAQATAQPTGVATTDLGAMIGASSTSVGHVVNVLKTFLTLYANNHTVTLTNTGNLSPASYTGTVRLDGAPSTVTANIASDIAAAATARNITNAALITATNMNNFIEDCRTIWTNRAFTSSVEEFKYNYCHSNCHSNCHANHGSRGRR